MINSLTIKPRIHQHKLSGQERNTYYGRRSKQNRNRSYHRDRFDRSSYRCEPQFGKTFRRVHVSNGNIGNSGSRNRNRQFPSNFREDQRSNSRSRLNSRSSSREIIRCYRCKKYNPFARDCPYMSSKK